MTYSLDRATLRTPLAILTVLILLNSACTIGNYSPAESSRRSLVEPQGQRDQREFLSFSYIPDSRDKPNSNPRTLPSQSQLVKDLLEQHARFMKVIVTSNPPAIGTHVNVYQTVGPFSSPWCTVSSWTLGVIPCYFEGIAYEIHFDVFVDNALKQSYRYPIYRKAVNWIGLVPFVWINFLTAQYEEAFSHNIYQFIADAKLDGFL
jgi:hypothetical protein